MKELHFTFNRDMVRTLMAGKEVSFHHHPDPDFIYYFKMEGAPMEEISDSGINYCMSCDEPATHQCNHIAQEACDTYLCDEHRHLHPKDSE